MAEISARRPVVGQYIIISTATRCVLRVFCILMCFLLVTTDLHSTANKSHNHSFISMTVNKLYDNEYVITLF